MSNGNRTNRRCQPDWMRTIEVGDVLRSGSGSLRVVRQVKKHPNGDLSTVWFAIKHCSWTHRPYTVLGHADLKRAGYSHTGVRVGLDSEPDDLLALNIANSEIKTLDCCDVRGWA